MYKVFLLIILLIILTLIDLILNKSNYFNIFSTQLNIIKYYVITLRNINRMENIKKQEKIFNININIFEAIKGVSINQEELINNNILNPIFKYPTIKRSNEIGCYMSHLTLLKNIKNIKNNNIDQSNYSVILEDDFEIINSDFQIIINDALLQIPNNFDILFLGYPVIIDESTNLNYSTNLYEFNNKNNIYGAYAYLINNNNIDKIIKNIEYIDMPIDIKYQELGYKNKLNIFFINPKIIDTNFGFASTIVV